MHGNLPSHFMLMGAALTRRQTGSLGVIYDRNSRAFRNMTAAANQNYAFKGESRPATIR